MLQKQNSNNSTPSSQRKYQKKYDNKNTNGKAQHGTRSKKGSGGNAVGQYENNSHSIFKRRAKKQERGF